MFVHFSNFELNAINQVSVFILLMKRTSKKEKNINLKRSNLTHTLILEIKKFNFLRRVKLMDDPFEGIHDLKIKILLKLYKKTRI